jgi:hypothetical protein
LYIFMCDKDGNKIFLLDYDQTFCPLLCAEKLFFLYYA